MIANQFYEFNDRLCECDWYLLSSDVQQLYLMFIKNTQEPVHIRCFGNLECTREVFKKVSETILSCGMKENIQIYFKFIFFLPFHSDNQNGILLFYGTSSSTRVEMW